MKVIETALPDVLVVESPVYRDHRGYFTEVYHAEKFAALGIPTRFAQDNHSESVRHVLRGLHYQVREPQGKLVRAATGVIFDVAVDLRRSSRTYGRWVGETLRAETGRQMWIPEGFGHGFLVLSRHADIMYKCTSPYRAEHDRAVRWDDPTIGIDWPVPDGVTPVLSEKDAGAPLLADAEVFA